MISAKTLVSLGLSVETGCTQQWDTLARGGQRRRVPHNHMCVGDNGHKGKHICPCGASRWVIEPEPPKEEHVHANVKLPDGTVVMTCTCSPEFARTAALGAVDFETPPLP